LHMNSSIHETERRFENPQILFTSSCRNNG
jgi:hypothetical protein